MVSRTNARACFESLTSNKTKLSLLGAVQTCEEHNLGDRCAVWMWRMLTRYRDTQGLHPYKSALQHGDRLYVLAQDSASAGATCRQLLYAGRRHGKTSSREEWRL